MTGSYAFTVMRHLSHGLHLHMWRRFSVTIFNGKGMFTQTLQVPIPHIYIQNWVITVPADVLAPNGARASADTVLTEQWDMFSSKFLQFSMIFFCFGRDDIIQNDRQDFTKSHCLKCYQNMEFWYIMEFKAMYQSTMRNSDHSCTTGVQEITN